MAPNDSCNATSLKVSASAQRQPSTKDLYTVTVFTTVNSKEFPTTDLFTFMINFALRFLHSTQLIIFMKSPGYIQSYKQQRARDGTRDGSDMVDQHHRD